MQGIGFTEKEYNYASKQGIPVVPFLHKNPDNLPRGKTEHLFQTIRVQFLALGLIESHTGSVKAHGGAEKTFRFSQLTDDGRTELVKVRAIYKP